MIKKLSILIMLLFVLTGHAGQDTTEKQKLIKKAEQTLENLRSTKWGNDVQTPVSMCENILKELKQAGLKNEKIYDRIKDEHKRFLQIKKEAQKEAEAHFKKAVEAYQKKDLFTAIYRLSLVKRYYKGYKNVENLYKKYMEEFFLKDMVLIPEGKVILGQKGYKDEPVREVFIKKFYIDKYEVTNRQYALFVKVTGHPAPFIWPYSKKGVREPPPKIFDHPVTCVSYEDAVAFAKWAGKRLPTADEWEKAARGSDKRIYPWGNKFPTFPNKMHANSVEYYGMGALGRPCKVGKFEEGKSPYGIYDMAGNVWEWTSTTIKRGKTTFQVLKGGSFMTKKEALRCSNIMLENPKMFHPDVGFRCVKDAE
jgi:formylglycine-generating enzyme required for sulfatase activity